MGRFNLTDMNNRYILSPYFLDEALPELESLAREGWIINTPVLSGETEQKRMSIIHSTLANTVEVTIKQGKRPVSIAGDCCTAFGVLAGLQRANINPILIWFDAHGDFNTQETSPSGFLGGMPLAMLVGLGDQTLPENVGLKILPENGVILTDARDLDPGERELLEESEVVHLKKVTDLLDYPLPPGPLYVHFDTDVVTAREVVAQNYLAPGGSSSTALKAVFQRLVKSGKVCCISLSTWNPKLDRDGKSEQISMSLLETLVR